MSDDSLRTGLWLVYRLIKLEESTNLLKSIADIYIDKKTVRENEEKFIQDILLLSQRIRKLVDEYQKVKNKNDNFKKNYLFAIDALPSDLKKFKDLVETNLQNEQNKVKLGKSIKTKLESLKKLLEKDYMISKINKTPDSINYFNKITELLIVVNNSIQRIDNAERKTLIPWATNQADDFATFAQEEYESFTFLRLKKITKWVERIAEIAEIMTNETDTIENEKFSGRIEYDYTRAEKKLAGLKDQWKKEDIEEDNTESELKFAVLNPKFNNFLRFTPLTIGGSISFLTIRNLLSKKYSKLTTFSTGIITGLSLYLITKLAATKIKKNKIKADQ